VREIQRCGVSNVCVREGDRRFTSHHHGRGRAVFIFRKKFTEKKSMTCVSTYKRECAVREMEGGVRGRRSGRERERERERKCVHASTNTPSKNIDSPRGTSRSTKSVSVYGLGFRV